MAVGAVCCPAQRYLWPGTISSLICCSKRDFYQFLVLYMMLCADPFMEVSSTSRPQTPVIGFDNFCGELVEDASFGPLIAAGPQCGVRHPTAMVACAVHSHCG